MMNRLPHPLVATIPLVVLIGLLAVIIALFGSDSLSGGSQVSLLAAMAVLTPTPVPTARAIIRSCAG